MSYYEPYVQGFSLRSLPESKKTKASRMRRKMKKFEIFIADLDENGNVVSSERPLIK